MSKESTLTAMDLNFAQQVLLWFDLSDYCSTFLHSPDIDYETLVVVRQKVNFRQPLFDPAGFVSKLCSPLMTVGFFK